MRGIDMILLKKKQNNVEGVLRTLLNYLKAKVTYTTSDQCVQEHPEYPSLLALSDCLSDWNIENNTYRIKKDEYNPKELMFPFLAHIREKGGRFILIHDIASGKVTYSDEQYKQLVISEEELFKKWDGIALHAESKENSGEKNFGQQYVHQFLKKLFVPISIILGIAICVSTVISISFSANTVLFSLIKFFGVGISILLLMQSIDNKNPLIQNLCGMAGKNDCNAILKSDAAYLTPWLSWSEIGFFYFTGSLLLLVIYPPSFSSLAWLNVLALPYTIYSFTYQYRQNKWCVLCCGIQVVLWLEFLITIISGSFQVNFLSPLFYYVPISFLLPIITWAFLKPIISRSIQTELLKEQLKNFKYNKNLFEKTMYGQVRYAVNNELMPIVSEILMLKP